LRIALTADPEIPVPPIFYGGIERIVDMLAQGLMARGHDVTVFAHRDSTTAGRLVPWPGHASRSRIDATRNAATLARYVFGRQFDLVHSFSRVAYLAPLLPLPIPKLMTYQRDISRRSVRFGHGLSHGSLWFSAISRQMMRPVMDVGTWRLVFNGVPLATYDFQPDPGPDAPLVFLGRVEEIKGPHLAIEVARRSGFPLVIAGNVPAEHGPFFEAKIKPHLDGSQVTYVGSVDDKAKNVLLGRARALLTPVLWEEPFGIVMAEAMVVAGDIDGLVAAVGRIGMISRANCRARVERLFSDRAVVGAYESVYCEMIAAAGARRWWG
jgi:glycosyltransferase involved in cell wall biosynthesis